MSGKIIAKSFLLKNHFDGLPKEEDFELVEKVLPPLADDGKRPFRSLKKRRYSDI